MLNLKGHNPLHVLAKYAKENAAAICNLFIETMPDFPLDRPDLDGNTGEELIKMNFKKNMQKENEKSKNNLGNR